MTPKEYLSQYKRLDLAIRSKLEQVDELREYATKASPSCGLGGSGDVSDKVGKTAAKIIDLENEINADIDRLVDLKREITGVIDAVPDEKLRLLLTLRYINAKTWEQITVELDITYRWVRVLHGRALSKIILPSTL